MATAIDVARYFVQLAERDDEHEPMTPMRVLKLLYYTQGWYLAWYGRPLFVEPIEAWEHGPVVPSVYNQWKSYDRSVISVAEVGEPTALNAEQRAAVEHVWRAYAQYSAIGLRDKTHRETPWQQAYQPDAHGRCANIITTEALQAYFGRLYTQQSGEPVGYGTTVQEAIAAGKTVSHEELLKQLGW